VTGSKQHDFPVEDRQTDKLTSYLQKRKCSLPFVFMLLGMQISFLRKQTCPDEGGMRC